jgi:4-hydroxy-3-polyprenylbenzoate decarboxylase
VKSRVVVAISGASGASIGIRVVELLSDSPSCEVHLVVSPSGERTVKHEVGPSTLEYLERLVTERHAFDDIGASIASGSFRTAGMIVAPCSIRSLSAIARSAADNLLTRAADVHLKERRRLVLVVRESPLHLGHLREMTAVTEMGAIVAPPVPAFYLRARSIAELVDHMARRAVSILDLPIAPPCTEWTGTVDLHARLESQ